MGVVVAAFFYAYGPPPLGLRLLGLAPAWPVEKVPALRAGMLGGTGGVPPDPPSVGWGVYPGRKNRCQFLIKQVDKKTKIGYIFPLTGCRF